MKAQALMCWWLGLAGSVLVSSGCASTPQQRWISGVCGTSVAFSGEVSSNIDVKPQASGGTHYNLEIRTVSPERGVRGFGCDLLPPSTRRNFSGAGLSDNALTSLKQSGFALAKDTTGKRGALNERKVRLEKKEESPFHLAYRWPDSQAFLNRAFWHETGKVSSSDVKAFFGSWVEGWGFYRPWQRVGIGECAAHFAFPAVPACAYIVGSDSFVTRCAAESGQARYVVECMLQKDDTEANEAAAFKALDRGLLLATKRAFGGTAIVNDGFVESARSNVPDLWTRGRRHTLRARDGRQNREALIAAKQATIYAIWVEWEGAALPSPPSVQRFFDSFAK